MKTKAAVELVTVQSSHAEMWWAKPETWVPFLSAWLNPRLRRRAVSVLRQSDYKDFYDDDPDWLELLATQLHLSIDETIKDLDQAIAQTVIRTFHGCRTSDAGEYFREGLRIHRTCELKERARLLVGQRDISTLDQRIAADIGIDIDEGRCFVVLDARELIRFEAHYLIYGSEWICAVLGEKGRARLLNIGVPTLLEIALPLQLVANDDRIELARTLLREWTRQVVARPKQVSLVDFTFTLYQDLNPENIMWHSHPTELRDPLEQQRLYRSPRGYCAYCTPQCDTG